MPPANRLSAGRSSRNKDCGSAEASTKALKPLELGRATLTADAKGEGVAQAGGGANTAVIHKRYAWLVRAVFF